MSAGLTAAGAETSGPAGGWWRLTPSQVGALRVVLGLPDQPGAPLPPVAAPAAPQELLTAEGVQPDDGLAAGLRAVAAPIAEAQVVVQPVGPGRVRRVVIGVGADGSWGAVLTGVRDLEVTGARSASDLVSQVLRRVGVGGQAAWRPLGRFSAAEVTVLLAGSDVFTEVLLQQRLARRGYGAAPQLAVEALARQVALGQAEPDPSWLVPAAGWLVPGGPVREPTGLAAGLAALEEAGWLTDGLPEVGRAAQLWAVLSGAERVVQVRWALAGPVASIGVLATTTANLLLSWPAVPVGAPAWVAFAGREDLERSVVELLMAGPT